MIKKVGLIIGALALLVIIWSLVFGEGGVVAMVWDGFAGMINDIWLAIYDNGEEIIPTFDSNDEDGEGGLNFESLD